MVTNILDNDIIEKNKLTTWEEIKNDKMNNNFLEALRNYIKEEEILMKDLATVDRIEEEYAVCELLDGNMMNIPISSFKEKVSEGDIFNLEVISEKGKLTYNIGTKNLEEMEIRRKHILEKLNKINKKAH